MEYLMRKSLLLMLITCLLSISISFAVPPHPLKKNGVVFNNSRASEIFGPRSRARRPAPEHVLVMLCEFSDVKFQTESLYPDYHPHNLEYFDIYMTHLKDFFLDASRYQYELNYTIHPNIVELNQTMGYYGDDSVNGERRAELARDVINAIDPDIDFNNYDAFILFHAGAGQESDIFDTQEHAIWSTFLTKANFRNKFDPDNMDYQGIETDDGSFISEIVIVPESQRHPDFPEEESPYLDDYVFDIFGVLAHQFGHQLGLPTLFDNYSANGSSSGIGNFGLMGTAVWNNNGKTPCLPSAWSRVYLGWNDPIVIETSQENLELTYPMNKTAGSKIVYKIPISDKEYFLIENRQANFRKDEIEVNGVINDHLFTFDVLPDSLQDYYPETNVPMPNMMTNVLRGCEWDYFFPYVDADTGQYVEPSGIFIWHIDENIIDEFFTDDFEINIPNGDAKHKGVDLEEADGIQHLDSSRPHMYMRGGPYDAYREGNNTYFGKSINPFNGDFSSPSSESYYGKSNIEIYNISASQDTMFFSVRFNHQTHFADTKAIAGEHIFVHDFNQDTHAEQYYISQNDNIMVDENGVQSVLSYDYANLQRFYGTYAYDSEEDKLFIPFSDEGAVSFDGESFDLFAFAENNARLTVPLITIPDTLFYQDKRVKMVGLSDNAALHIWFADHSALEYEIEAFTPFSNMTYYAGFISFLARKDGTNYLVQIDLKDMTIDSFAVEYAPDINQAYLLQADFDNDGVNDYSFCYQTGLGTFVLCLFDSAGKLFQGFPVESEANSISIPIIADMNNIGKLDIIVGTEKGYQAYAANGQLLNPHYEAIEADSSQTIESLISINKGDKVYIMALLGKGRLCLWSERGRMITGYPIVYNKAKGNPFIHVENDSVFAYIGTEDGNIYRQHLSEFDANDIENSNFMYAYGNLNRTASWHKSLSQNILKAEELFIKGENYIYPTPWLYMYDNKMTIRVMLSKSAKVKANIYNIAGELIWQKTGDCAAFVPDNSSFIIDTTKLSTGVYIAILEANNKLCRLKFAVEK
jgi:M6 family metalloprotease-like protein